ncbi:MAG: hypothetical protein JXB38_00770, partial [Anaerolineales bacterium]|nr:hypothetical protein [Anaerolineales bacterium]
RTRHGCPAHLAVGGVGSFVLRYSEILLYEKGGKLIDEWFGSNFKILCIFELFSFFFPASLGVHV